MSNQQLGKCRTLPYEVWPNLFLQSLVHIDSVYNNPKQTVNLLCWGLVSLSEGSQAWHCQVLRNVQLVKRSMLLLFFLLLLIQLISDVNFKILYFTIKFKQHYCSSAKATSLDSLLKLDVFYVLILTYFCFSFVRNGIRTYNMT